MRRVAANKKMLLLFLVVLSGFACCSDFPSASCVSNWRSLSFAIVLGQHVDPVNNTTPKALSFSANLERIQGKAAPQQQYVYIVREHRVYRSNITPRPSRWHAISSAFESASLFKFQVSV